MGKNPTLPLKKWYSLVTILDLCQNAFSRKQHMHGGTETLSALRRTDDAFRHMAIRQKISKDRS